MLNYLQSTFLGIAMIDWGFLVVALVVGIVLRAGVLAFLRRVLERTKLTRIRADELIIDAAMQPAGAMAILMLLWLAISWMVLPREPFDVERFAHALRLAAVVFAGVWFLIRLNNRVAAFQVEKASRVHSPLADVIPLIRTVVSVFFVAIGLLVILQLLGYTVTSLVAGLGIGGVILGLAARGGMGSFFGSLMIFLDRPFTRGDLIRMGDQQGIVLDSSLRVTHIRGYDGSLITVPNSLIVTGGVTTWARRRRINHTLQFTYGATPEQIEEFVRRLKEVILSDDRFYDDNVVVTFSEIGEFSLDVLLNCYTKSIEYPIYADIHQELLLKIMQLTKELGLEFAFPTRTIVASGAGAPGSGGE